ncbi:hypothetical protein B0H13DRAFT_2111644 [Mycena leptocephala]|nr:hypothetical protein B0H13DRAFT_2111644 [Mycena leptocephala]
MTRSRSGVLEGRVLGRRTRITANDVIVYSTNDVIVYAMGALWYQFYYFSLGSCRRRGGIRWREAEEKYWRAAGIIPKSGESPPICSGTRSPPHGNFPGIVKSDHLHKIQAASMVPPSTASSARSPQSRFVSPSSSALVGGHPPSTTSQPPHRRQAGYSPSCTDPQQTTTRPSLRRTTLISQAVRKR